MKKYTLLTLIALLVMSSLFAGSQIQSVQAREPKILEFDTMVGVPSAFTGTQAPIRGINGGGLPWRLTAARGELTTSGHLEITVTGLVFASGPNTGANTVPFFKAVVSCLKSDTTIDNESTGLFPATIGPASLGGGNASIEADLTLPQPCIAPIIFVTSPTGSWFASTGF